MLIKIILLTLVINILIIGSRLIFGSMKNFYKKNRNLKIRIHHGYIGILLVLIYLCYPIDNIFIAGVSLVLSDAIHHFVILPLWVGSTEFP